MRSFRSGVVTLSRNGNSNTVTLPPRLVKELGLLLGDHLAIRRAGNSIVLVPIEQAIRGRFLEDQAAVSEAAREVAKP